MRFPEYHILRQCNTRIINSNYTGEKIQIQCAANSSFQKVKLIIKLYAANNFSNIKKGTAIADGSSLWVYVIVRKRKSFRLGTNSLVENAGAMPNLLIG